MNLRVGFGFDVHQLAADRRFRLGGVDIEHHKGVMGHSDADVLIHAICDALLGAAGLRDIGNQFPDSSAAYKDIDSTLLLERVVTLLHARNYLIGNVDATVCLEQPKINIYIDSMKSKMAAIMQTDTGSVSIKATTNEKLGYVGREEGIAAYAVALIYKKESVSSHG
jgi:2-C-methyl-D-erythritol 2,4-cyclodiphosphate synthase